MNPKAERDHMIAGARFTPTPEHAPEPGMGGSAYRMMLRHTVLGVVRSEWNRTDGVHWYADFGPHLRTLVDVTSKNPRRFSTRADAAYALAWEAKYAHTRTGA